ncbi:ATP-binding protein [Sphaerospermopsis aphanizomenoides BCCUSP55]|uniref:ATP-binding protein n=1 Tax=Sphaerospermopsis aphanizomenoides TaxID=459663 RepID=UPI001905EB0B|nr:ATP-binding protein [Sphaerospermopsis aphanizomenoides]MBK1986787.1 ATP-binding protein [Sphaerospermopsis aphanizomenoides BCCUSP55]
MESSDIVRPQDLKQLDIKIAAANVMSQSLLFSLGRQYLDVQLTDAKYIQPLPPKGILMGDPYFLKVEQVGSSLTTSLSQPFTALQTALSACHNPEKYHLVFIISSDGTQNQVYLGICSKDSLDSSSEDFIGNIGKFLQGNWQGTKFRCLDTDTQEVKSHIVQPLNKFHYAQAITGIPSLKPGDHPGYPQSLDRLLSGMRGSPFMYMVIAEPMSEAQVNGIIYGLRELMGRVHSFSKINFNETFTQGISLNRGRTDSTSESIAETFSTSYEEVDNSGLNMAVLTAMRSLGLGIVFPPMALMSLLVADVALDIAPLLSRTYQQTQGKTTTKTTGVSISENQGFNLSSAQAFGEEYINAHAQAAEAQIKKYLERFEQSRALGCWNVGAYLLAEKPDILQQASTQLRSLLSGENSVFEPIRIHDLKRVWNKTKNSLQNFDHPDLALVNPNNQQQKLDHPLGKAFNGLTTPLNTQELALLVNLPRHEVPGVKVMPTATFSLNPPVVEGKAILLGNVLEGGEPTPLKYSIALSTLAKHCLVTGITGSGKSTTCRKMLTELNQQQIPFLIIEPAKEEYVEWAMEYNQSLPPNSPNRIAIYMPGIQTWRGNKLENKLTLNPFDIVWLSQETTPQILSHIDRLKSILTAAFPMQEILPILLEDVLFYAYTRPQNWLGDDPPPYGTPRPTLSQLLDQISLVIKGKGYEDRITANLTAALTTRVQSLRRGWKKQLFDQPQSTNCPQIFDRPAVINLAHLGDDADKAFAMAILLQFLYEYRQAQNELLTLEQHKNNSLRHVTVIEEAHRILLKVSSGSIEQANPQAKVAEMFANILSEIRAYGQGLMIVDQVPNRLVPDAIKNTNLKIVHRLVAADDRDAMSACMALTTDQSMIINRLRPGQAIVCGEQDDMAAWVQILK